MAKVNISETIETAKSVSDKVAAVTESTESRKPDEVKEKLSNLNTITHKLMFNNRFVEVDFHGKYPDGSREFMENLVSQNGKFWDSENLEYIYSINGSKLHEGDFVDAGGNVGNNSVFWLLFEKSCKRILYIEPEKSNINVALKNFARHDKDNRVIVFKGAVGSKNGEVVSLYDSQFQNMGAVTAFPENSGKGRGKIIGEAITQTIDSLVDQYKLNPIFIKLDIEGGEYDALLGAVETIRKFKPLIYTEIWTNSAFNDNALTKITEFMKKEGYLKGWSWGEEHYYWYHPNRNVDGKVGYTK